ncbi:hypothetical protein V7S43_016304 [Phytophthora oleae]|uniref:Uncharacterized protein n=1 Tax=Phytophthora oleae TaxID=2107226 RepID=A0ABD3EW33_9STRA
MAHLFGYVTPFSSVTGSDTSGHTTLGQYEVVLPSVEFDACWEGVGGGNGEGSDREAGGKLHLVLNLRDDGCEIASKKRNGPV